MIFRKNKFLLLFYKLIFTYYNYYYLLYFILNINVITIKLNISYKYETNKNYVIYRNKFD